jgi:hypothetical protein
MLVPNLRPKVVPHGPRLLPDLIVRTRGRLVAGAPSLLRAQEEARPSAPALRPRGHHSGHTRPVAPLAQRARLLALRSRTPTCLLPEPVHPESQFNRRVRALESWSCALCRASLRRGALRAFGRLPGLGHDPGAGHREGEGFWQGALCRSGHLHEAYLAYPRASRASSGRDTGWSATGLWWLPPRRTTPAGHGRRRIGDGPQASARSSRG